MFGIFSPYKRLNSPVTQKLGGVEADAADLMPPDSLLSGTPTARRLHLQPRNLGRYMRNVYDYYFHKGLAPMVLGLLRRVVCSAVVTAWVVLVVGFVDWTGFSEQSVPVVADGASTTTIEFTDFVVPWTGTPAQVACIAWACLASLCTLTWSVWHTCTHIAAAVEVRPLFAALRVTDEQLQDGTVLWDDLVNKLVDAHNTCSILVSHKFSSRATNRDAVKHTIRQIVTAREELCRLVLHSDMGSGFVYSEWRPLSRIAVWFLREHLLEALFDAQGEVTRARFSYSGWVRSRAIVVGVACACLTPVLLPLLVASYVVENLEQLHRGQNVLGRSSWTLYAYWKFRRELELPHETLTAMYNATAHARLYERDLRSYVARPVLDMLSYVVKAALALGLLILAFSDESIIQVHVGGRALLWYMTALVISAGLLSQPPAPDAPAVHEHVIDNSQQLQRLFCASVGATASFVRTTRYSWRLVFAPGVLQLCYELWSVCTFPWFCLWLVARRADTVVRVLQSCTAGGGGGHGEGVL